MTDPDPSNTRALIEAGYDHAVSPFPWNTPPPALPPDAPPQLLPSLSTPQNSAAALTSSVPAPSSNADNTVDISSAQIGLANLQRFLNSPA